MSQLDPRAVWDGVLRGELRMLDLRTAAERHRDGAPPGAIPVSLALHVLRPEREGVAYLCRHGVRSKLALRNGAVGVAGGFVAWRDAALPLEHVD